MVCNLIKKFHRNLRSCKKILLTFNLFLFLGCAGVIVGHPLDTVKVCLQTQSVNNPKYNGTVDCLRQLIAKEGIRGVYRGMSSPLAGVAAINAIVFGVYGNAQRNLKEPDALSSYCIAGAAAGFSQSFFCSPMELAKSRVQVAGDSNGPLQCLKNIYLTEGYRGIFRGLGITLAREIPAFGSYFITYEYLTRSKDNKPASTLTMLFAGGLAGVVSWAIVYPVDVLKSRIQIDGMTSPAKYLNTMDCLRKSIKSEGYSFLFKGITPTLLRAFPVNAACFVVVTWTMRICQGNWYEGIAQKEKNIWEICTDTVKSLNTPV